MLVAQNIRHSKTLADVVNEKKERDENKAILKATTGCWVAFARKDKRKKVGAANVVRRCEQLASPFAALRVTGSRRFLFRR
jgi:hypothetical protein